MTRATRSALSRIWSALRKAWGREPDPPPPDSEALTSRLDRLDPKIRAALEASWKRNEKAYRYLARDDDSRPD